MLSCWRPRRSSIIAWRWRRSRPASMDSWRNRWRWKLKMRSEELQVGSDWSSDVCSSDLDAFVLATPAEQHHRMALAAIAAGKHVFVEKPLALEAEDGLEMVKAARERGTILMVGHLLRSE